MNIQQIVNILVDSGIEPQEANIEVKMLIEHFCQYNALDIIRGVPLDYEKLKIVEEKAKYRAQTKKPVQYIIGKAYFMKNLYKVDENVLIPRGETEEVVSKVLDIIQFNNFKTVLDIGTGSGCIACTIAENFDCKVTAVDISVNALDIAKENAKNLKLSEKIEFIESDLFENINDRKFDLIVSNPPYIPKNTPLQQEVGFEPYNALFTEDEKGLYFYEKIISQSKRYLNEGGYLAFEIGYNQGQDVFSIMEANNFKNITLEKDLMGQDRILYGNI